MMGLMDSMEKPFLVGGRIRGVKRGIWCRWKSDNCGVGGIKEAYGTTQQRYTVRIVGVEFQTFGLHLYIY